MSKPVKQLIRKELSQRIEGITSVAVLNLTGVDAIATNKMRGRLLKKDIRVTVVKNSLARQSFKEIGLDVAVDLLDGPCALAYGGESVVSVVRELLDIRKDVPNLTVKAAVMEGEVFSGEAEVDALSKFPTRDEAIAEVLGCVISAGANVAACVMAPASEIASLIKAVQEKAEEAA